MAAFKVKFCVFVLGGISYVEFIKLIASVAEDGPAEVDGVELVTAAAMAFRCRELAVALLTVALTELEDMFA